MPRPSSSSAAGQTVTADDALRGSRGLVGKGTPGSRLKSRNTDKTPLRAFARRHAALAGSPFQADAIKWLTSKGARVEVA